jgi:hypothetical protein
MSKPPLRDRNGLRQQAGVAMDLALLAVEAESCPADYVIGKAVPDKPIKSGYAERQVSQGGKC